MNYFTFGFIVFLLIGLIFTPLGYLIGRTIWGRRRKQVANLVEVNTLLEEQLNSAKKRRSQLQTLLEELS